MPILFFIIVIAMFFFGGGGDIGNGEQFELRSFPNPDYDFSSTRSDCNGDIDLSYNLWIINFNYEFSF